MLELLLEYAGNELRFDILDKNGLTPLHYAICNWSNFELIWNSYEPNVIQYVLKNEMIMSEKNLLLITMLQPSLFEKYLFLFHEENLQGLLGRDNKT